MESTLNTMHILIIITNKVLRYHLKTKVYGRLNGQRSDPCMEYIRQTFMAFYYMGSEGFEYYYYKNEISLVPVYFKYALWVCNWFDFIDVMSKSANGFVSADVVICWFLPASFCLSRCPFPPLRIVRNNCEYVILQQ